MKRLLLAMLLCTTASVVGCTSVFTPEQAATIRAASLGACKNIARVEVAYEALVTGGAVSVNTQRKGAAIFASAHAFCDSAAQLEPESALLTGATLFLRVSQIYKEARSG